jgi:hypothetical protein
VDVDPTVAVRVSSRGNVRYDAMAIVEQLLANPGLYVGKDTVAGSDLVGAARIMVSPLPGKAGVSLDYEILNGLAPGPVRGHVEHTLIGRADDGATVMVIAHAHGQGITILRETEPGVFEPSAMPSPYPMKVVVSVPEPGRLRHAWWYGPAGRPGGRARRRRTGDRDRLNPGDDRADLLRWTSLRAGEVGQSPAPSRLRVLGWSGDRPRSRGTISVTGPLLHRLVRSAINLFRRDPNSRCLRSARP